MTPKRAVKSRQEISPTLIDTVCRRLSENKRVRRTLPGNGRLHVDRQLPFLCVYRRPPDSDDLGTERLVKGEASYLIAPGSATHSSAVSGLVSQLGKTMLGQFGAFLVVEVWAGPDGGKSADAAVPSVLPAFQIVAPPSSALAASVDVLARRLKRVKVLKQAVEVEVLENRQPAPPGMPPLLDVGDTGGLKLFTIGLIVPPVYRDAKTGAEFPLLMRQFRRSLGRALRQTFYRFTLSQTTHKPPHYHELGRRAVVKAVWEIDEQLGRVSNAFDFLLQLTPVNADEAWQEFKESGFERTPEFHYRPMPFDPSLLKRQLYQVSIERVEDPALQHVFQEKQRELDRKITMLAERDTPRFLYGSLQLYGGVEDDLFQLATQLLERLPREPGGKSGKRRLTAEAFAKEARAEFDYYRAKWPDFAPKAEVTGRVAGIMVSRGKLLINRNTTVPSSRVKALLQHEVGTHLLTYYNGRAQPFRQLYSGLAGYEALQEGLAVLAEYLAGGLDRPRMRQLAARVVAAQQLIEGASFVETFRTLHHTFGLPSHSVFKTTMRVYRGGGLTKDAVYLRGLRQILDYVRRGGELEPLFVGKIATDQVAIVKELLLRRVLRMPPLRPRYMDSSSATKRLAALRNREDSVLGLVE
ncbi:flavohemoglobin expression-modulating QEGLA motif protein [Planctomycetota bacterium]